MSDKDPPIVPGPSYGGDESPGNFMHTHHQGRKVVIVSNRVECVKCGDVVESKTRHDFRWCSCKTVATDGGIDYIRRVGDPAYMIDRSTYLEVEDEDQSERDSHKHGD